MENDSSPTLHAYGNGRMLVYGDGVTIRSVQGPPYSSPVFCSLALYLRDDERSGKIFTFSERLEKTNIRTHSIIFSANQHYSVQPGFSPDIHITDFLDPSRCIFVRSIESFEKLRHRIVIPRGAYYSLVNAYPIKGDKYTVGIITIPRGTPFFAGECSDEERRLMIIPVGEASFSDSGNEIISDTGVSGILLVSGDSQEEIISSAAYALSSAVSASTVKECKIYRECAEHWRSRLNPISEIAHRLTTYQHERERILRTAEDSAILLLCHISKDGSVLSGCERPMMFFSDAAVIVCALCSLGYEKESKRILTFIFKAWTQGRYLSAEDDDCHFVPHISVKSNNDGAITPASIINAVFCYYEQTHDTNFVRELMPMLIWASRTLCAAVNHSALSFSGGERAFEYGILPLSVSHHASFEATLLAVIAARRMIGFVDEHALRNRSRYYAPLADMLEKLEVSCRKYFVSGNNIYCSNSLRDYGLRLPRFRYGYCESCAEQGLPLYLRWLERGRSGGYVCPACYDAKKLSGDAPPKNILLCSASALPSYHTGKLFSETEKFSFIEPYLRELAQNGYIPSSPGSTLMSGEDPGKLLGALNRIIEASSDKYLTNDIKKLGSSIVTAMLDLTGGAHTWAGLYDKTSPLSDRADPCACAYNINAILGYMKLYSRFSES